MKKIAFISFIFSIFIFASCATNYRSSKTSLELQSIQAKEFEANKDVTFAATMSVFQDLGYSISSAEINTGLISAKSPTNHSNWNNDDTYTEATAFIEYFPTKKVTKVRLNFLSVRSFFAPFTTTRSRTDDVIDDLMIYQNAFSKIQEGIFIRTGTK